ncbi:MAG TPA: hypothetical protein VMW01_16715 [Williamwhitmania sp.]|nr:hypothetical protein [Williamwhitmania sp.]
MKRNVIFLFLLTYSVLSLGQTEKNKTYNVSQIQGVWQLYFGYLYDNNNAFYKIFYIYNGKKNLKIDIRGNPYDKLSVTVTNYGFGNSYDRDSICKMKQLNDTGKVYVEMDENADVEDCLVNIATIFELTPKSYLNIFGDECNYLESAPKEVLEVLYKRGMHDKRDYIKEFLGLRVCGIQAEKSFIYDSTLNKTKMYLIKDDIITVTSERDGFVEMEYETAKGKIIKGWVRKEDLGCIETPARL